MSAEEECKLFVAGLSEAVTEDGLRQMFESTQAVVSDISVPRDRSTGKPRGFAFVTLETAEQAKASISMLDGTMLDGKAVSVRPFRTDRTSQAPRSGERMSRHPGPPSQRGGGGGSDDSTLYVGNLPFDASQEDITAFFAEAGFSGVKRIHLPTDAEGRKRGFGFVTLTDADTAKKAAESMEGRFLQGRSISVNIARRGGGGGGGGGGSAGPRSVRPQRPPAEDRGGGSMPPRSMRSIPPPSITFGDAPQEEGRRSGGRREKKKDKKRKGRGLAPERGPKRRRNEGFGAPRARGGYDDWDDD